MPPVLNLRLPPISHLSHTRKQRDGTDLLDGAAQPVTNRVDGMAAEQQAQGRQGAVGELPDGAGDAHCAGGLAEAQPVDHAGSVLGR